MVGWVVAVDGWFVVDGWVSLLTQDHFFAVGCLLPVVLICC